MSWIFGFLSKHNIANLNIDFSSIHPPTVYQTKNEKLYIATGGLKETCLYGSFSNSAGFESKSGWIVVGLGIELHSDHCRLLSSNDWQSVLSFPRQNFDNLDGHFIIIRWNENKIELFNDQLGLRTIYFYQRDDGIAFSTRLDWIAKLIKSPSIDFKAFGPRWLTFNQLSYQSYLNETTRLPPGGSAVCTADSLFIQKSSWLPNRSKFSERSFESIVSAFINPKNNGYDSITFGLSGGLDSRFLLAMFLYNQKKITIHNWGHLEHPDVKIAQKIIKQENLENTYIEEPIPSADECITLLREYECHACMNEPASSILKLRYYPKLRAHHKLMIDGGFGEIARRIHLNRIIYKGRKALRSGNPQSLLPFLELKRGTIFNEDTLRLMEEGSRAQVEEVWEDMPPMKELGEENFIELFAIRTRVPNWGTFEQSRLDCDIPNYMPLVQPSLLHKIFQIPVSDRKHGKLFRKLISKCYPSLTRFPLVRGNLTHPFNLNSLQAFAWTKIKSKMQLGFVNPLPSQFLDRLSEFIMDTVHSESVKSFSAYNYPLLLKMVEDYYSGKKELQTQIDWWLSFEIWRQSIYSK
ncbi:MAG: hypothetical protein ABIK27_07120 [Bacteroidota bacterium]